MRVDEESFVVVTGLTLCSPLQIKSEVKSHVIFSLHWLDLGQAWQTWGNWLFEFLLEYASRTLHSRPETLSWIGIAKKVPTVSMYFLQWSDEIPNNKINKILNNIFFFFEHIEIAFFQVILKFYHWMWSLAVILIILHKGSPHFICGNFHTCMLCWG